MKCEICGSEITDQKSCPICGANMSNNKSENESNIYTGIDETTTPTYTRSRLVALLLSFIGGNDLYLYYWSRFIWKMVVVFATCGIGYIIWQVIDIIRIAVGGFKYDAHGNPVEW